MELFSYMLLLFNNHSVGSREDVLECRRYYEASTDPELIARCEARLKGTVAVSRPFS